MVARPVIPATWRGGRRVSLKLARAKLAETLSQKQKGLGCGRVLEHFQVQGPVSRKEGREEGDKERKEKQISRSKNQTFKIKKIRVTGN
jgi:hypothetical protein